jgi:indolepyruvate ferredoxin oxidoreductase, beta subunit
MTFNCMIAGVGGQGTVLASKLIAAAAMKAGFNVRTTETIGMAQRGGSVVSHIRIGDDIFSPLIPFRKADALIAFEPGEAVRQLPFLSGQGILVVCDSIIKPAGMGAPSGYEASAMIDYLKANIQKLTVIDGRRITEHNAKTLNTAMLGAAAQSGIFPFDAETLKDIIPEMLPQRFWEMNFKSFEIGKGAYNEHI